jgi:hypothetical protein
MKWRRLRAFVAGFTIGTVLLGCGTMVKHTAIHTMSEIIVAGRSVYEREPDVALATQALAANLKLIEAILESAPRHPGLLLQAAQGFAIYAYAVAEGQLAEDGSRGAADVEAATRRTRDLYSRGLQYGLRALSRYHADWLQATSLDVDALNTHLQQLSSQAVPDLFWVAFCWGGVLKMTHDVLDVLPMVPRFEALVKRLIALDESYLYGAPHLLFAVHHASRSPLLGGRPDQAKVHFGRAAELSQDKLLLVPLLEAQYYAVQIQDRDHFVSSLRRILQAPETLLPEQAFLNAVAKQRASLLLKQVNDLFV